MVQRTNVYHKESEIRAVHLKQSTAKFDDAAKITVDSAGEILQGKQSGNDEAHQINPYNKKEANKSVIRKT